MAAPSLSDFTQAIQVPHIVFADRDLAQGKVETNANGTPKPRSGGFAVTFQIENGPNRWAIRCFHREVPDLELRYAHISTFLQSHKFARMVSFEYLADGMLVNGSRYPIVKMPWISGQTLERFVESHISNRQALDFARSQFQEAVAALEQSGAAHGDLQHGNILVGANGLSLIDYDGMYVPALAGLPANEDGHRNYQSPLRTESDFDPGLDRFSAIVISLSLEAIEIAPSLWDKDYAAGETLLFKSRDFANPGDSEVFKKLRKIPQLTARVDQLALLTRTPLDQLPTLADFNLERSLVHRSQTVQPPANTKVRLHQFEIVDARERDRLLRSVGDVVQIVGKIVEISYKFTKYGKPFAFIDFGNWQQKDFRLTAWSETLAQLDESEIDLDRFKNTWITITGLVEKFRGTPQMTLENASDLRLLPGGEAEAQKLIKESNGFVTMRPTIPTSTTSRNRELMDKVKSTATAKTPPATSTSAVPTPSPGRSSTRNQDILDQLRKDAARASSGSNTSDPSINPLATRTAKPGTPTQPQVSTPAVAPSAIRVATASKGTVSTGTTPVTALSVPKPNSNAAAPISPPPSATLHPHATVAPPAPPAPTPQPTSSSESRVLNVIVAGLAVLVLIWIILIIL